MTFDWLPRHGGGEMGYAAGIDAVVLGGRYPLGKIPHPLGVENARLIPGCVEGIRGRALDPAGGLHRHAAHGPSGKPGQQIHHAGIGIGEAYRLLLRVGSDVEPFAADIYTDPDWLCHNCNSLSCLFGVASPGNCSGCDRQRSGPSCVTISLKIKSGLPNASRDQAAIQVPRCRYYGMSRRHKIRRRKRTDSVESACGIVRLTSSPTGRKSAFSGATRS
jgi:hypothetical protein